MSKRWPERPQSITFWDRRTKRTPRIYITAYKGADGEAKASLNCHVNNIKIHSSGKQTTHEQEEISAISAEKKEEVTDDLPF